MEETAGRVPGRAAAILYVLAAPQPGTGTPAYLLHEVGGVSCVIAYTDLTRLVDCCGEHQPWLAVEVAILMADLREQGLPGPVVNLPLNSALWWTASGPPYRMPASDHLIVDVNAVDVVAAGSTSAKGGLA